MIQEILDEADLLDHASSKRDAECQIDLRKGIASTARKNPCSHRIFPIVDGSIRLQALLIE